MKRTLSLLFLSLAVMLGLSMAAMAQDTIHFNGNTQSFWHVGTGIYYGTLNGSSMSFTCDDFLDGVSTSGQTWEAHPYTITQLPSTQVVWGGTLSNSHPIIGENDLGVALTTPRGQVQAYDEVLWLAQMIIGGVSNSTADAMSYAIWAILDSPPASNFPTGTAGASGWINQADTWYSTTCNGNQAACNTLLANMVIYVPYSWTSSGPPQEFVGETPEPVSMALMGTFLTLAGLALGKKKLFS